MMLLRPLLAGLAFAPAFVLANDNPATSPPDYLYPPLIPDPPQPPPPDGPIERREWSVAAGMADDIISQLNITEKAMFVTGASQQPWMQCVGNVRPLPSVNFTGICLMDGPQAVNRADLISIFPSGMSVAATWDEQMMYERGFALGSEFRGKGGHVGLGPSCGPLGRHPLGGRNWEGFSPDPYLTGRATSGTVRGMQDAGVQAATKHYIANEQETQRSNSKTANGTRIEAISSNVGDRALHELYLWPFVDAVKAGTSAVMCAYNRINQTYACENDYLLNTILKGELGFEGYVVSDWLATHSGAKSANAGLDLNMPGAKSADDFITEISYWNTNLAQFVKDGEVSEDRLDDMVRRVLTPFFHLKQDADFPIVDGTTLVLSGIATSKPFDAFEIPFIPPRDVRQDHAQLIRRIGSAGTVLLKNVNNTLPLKAPQQVGVFGNDAADVHDGLLPPDPSVGTSLFGPDIGTLDIGGGSGTGRHSNLVPPLEAIKNQVRSDGGRVQYLTNNEHIAAGRFNTIYPVIDVCIVFLKTWTTESQDRLSWEADWNSTLIVENVASFCNNTVVVTHSGGVNTMPWADHPNVTAILAAHFPGEETGNSIVDLLWGKENPSGRLPYTVPKNESDYDFPVVNLTEFTPTSWQANFTEGLFIDYRHFDAHNITPLYEFGYGLSYTTFELADALEVESLVEDPSAEPNASIETAPGGNPDLWTNLLRLKTSVTNTGSMVGQSVVQLYLSMPKDTTPPGTPVQVLRGFQKIPLEPGETKDVEFLINRRDLSFWDEPSRTWIIPRGAMEFKVGFSSRDLPEQAQVVVVQ